MDELARDSLIRMHFQGLLLDFFYIMAGRDWIYDDTHLRLPLSLWPFNTSMALLVLLTRL